MGSVGNGNLQIRQVAKKGDGGKAWVRMRSGELSSSAPPLFPNQPSNLGSSSEQEVLLITGKVFIYLSPMEQETIRTPACGDPKSQTTWARSSSQEGRELCLKHKSKVLSAKLFSSGQMRH